MKLNERGLSQGALIAIIVGIVVATVVPVTIAAVLLIGGGGGAPGGLPVYSGATEFKRSENDVSGGHLTTACYDLGTANLGDVYNWYKTAMPNQGWTLAADYSSSLGSNQYWFTYTKGNDSAEIYIFSGTADGHSGNILILACVTSTSAAPC